MAMMSDVAPTLSVVVPALDEEGNVEALYLEIRRVLEEMELPWELIFVDDGSHDDTWGMIRQLHDAEPRVRGVRLTRNFGHQHALFAGLERAQGEAVISMDADLQHPPQVIPRLVEEWRKGAQVVHGRRVDSARVSWFKRISSLLYYKLFSFLTGTELRNGMADFRLMSRRAVDSLLSFGEEGLFLRGLVQWMGFPDSTVEFECAARHSGASRYTLRRMMRLGWRGITSFSLVPLRLCIVLGLLTSAVAFEQGVEAIYRKLVLHSTVPGWTQTMVVMTFLFGVLFILLGIIGEYVGRILVEARGRPRFLVRDELG